jgi:hypothetical protein
MALYCAGLLVLIGVLVTRSPWFGLFALTGYLHTWELLSGRWRVAGVTATAALHVTAIFGGRLPDPNLPAVAAFLLMVAVSASLAVAFSRWGEITTEQNEQRKRIIVELAEANAKLEAAMAENAELQARLLAQAREAGTLDERQRMAREIHDTLAQGLTGIITQVQAARNAAERPADWRRHLDNAADLARESLSEARRTVQAVGPEPLEQRALGDALAESVPAGNCWTIVRPFARRISRAVASWRPTWRSENAVPSARRSRRRRSRCPTRIPDGAEPHRVGAGPRLRGRLGGRLLDRSGDGVDGGAGVAGVLGNVTRAL